MSMVITLTISDETARRIEAVAATRGETIEQVTAEALDSSPLLAGPAGGGNALVDEEFIALVDDVIVEHRTILDRLAAT